MLLVEFSIRVEPEHFDEVMKVFDMFDIRVDEIRLDIDQIHDVVVMKCIDCIGRLKNVRKLLDYLDDEYEHLTTLSFNY